MATGTGKTRVFIDLLQPQEDFDFNKIIFVFPSLPLISQCKNDYIDKYNIPNVYYICSENRKDYYSVNDPFVNQIYQMDEYLIITTYQSLPTLLDNLHEEIPADCIMFDEAHHEQAYKCQEAISKNSHKFINKLSGSATLGASNDPCFQYTFTDAVRDKICKDYEIVCFVRKDTPENRKDLISRLIETYKSTGNGRIMAFTAYSEADKDGTYSVNSFLQQYSDPRIWIKGITANHSKEQRDNIIREFSQVNDKLAILVSCKTLSEGVDVKYEEIITDDRGQQQILKQCANGVLFVDTCRSTITIIQRIGRAVRMESHNDNPATIIVSVYVDPKKYEDCKTEEETDAVLRESMSENGDFSNIFSILVALKQEDPERYYNIMHSNKVRKYQKATDLSIQDSKQTGNTLLDHVSKTLKKSQEDIKTDIIQYVRETDTELYEQLQEVNDWDSLLTPEILAGALNLKVKVDEYSSQGELESCVYDPQNENSERDSDEEKSENDTPDIHLFKDGYKYSSVKKSKPKSIKSKIRMEIDTDLKVMWKLSDNVDLESSLTSKMEFIIEDDGKTGEEKALERWRTDIDWCIKYCDENGIKYNTYTPKKRCKNPEEKRIGISLSNYKVALKGTGKSVVYSCVNELIENSPFLHWLVIQTDEEKALEKCKINIDWCIKYCDDNGMEYGDYRPNGESENLEEKQIGQWLTDYRKALKGTGKNKVYPSKNDLISKSPFPHWLKGFDLEKYKELEEKTPPSSPKKSNPSKSPTKKELIEKAKLLGIEIRSKDTKEIIQQKIDNSNNKSGKDDAIDLESINQSSGGIKHNTPKTSKKPPKKTVKKPPKPLSADESGSSIPRKISELSEYHRIYNGKPSRSTQKHFQDNPSDWHNYHTLLHKSYEGYNPQNVPVNRIIKYLEGKRHKKTKTIADMGCGYGEIAQHFHNTERYDVISLDYVAFNKTANVKICNMKETGLPDESVNYVIFCLSLMGDGQDIADYIEEAIRIMDDQGEIIIVEPSSSRWIVQTPDGTENKLETLLGTHLTITKKTTDTERFIYYYCSKKQE
jgi:superfamily II DNA or RNA helicase/ubiquinone/menaquinone biosynthesis C-methylase UbiE